MYQITSENEDIFKQPVNDGDIIVFGARAGNSGQLRVAIVLDVNKRMVRSMQKAWHGTLDRISGGNGVLNNFQNAMVVDPAIVPSAIRLLLRDFYNKYKETH